MLKRLLLPATVVSAMTTGAVHAQINNNRTTFRPQAVTIRPAQTNIRPVQPMIRSNNTTFNNTNNNAIPPASQLYLPGGTTLAGPARFQVTAQPAPNPTNTTTDPINNGTIQGPYLINGQYYYYGPGIGYFPATGSFPGNQVPPGSPVFIDPDNGTSRVVGTGVRASATAPVRPGFGATQGTTISPQFQSPQFAPSVGSRLLQGNTGFISGNGVAGNNVTANGVTPNSFNTNGVFGNGTQVAPGVNFVPNNGFAGNGFAGNGFYGGGYYDPYLGYGAAVPAPQVQNPVPVRAGNPLSVYSPVVPTAGLNASPLGRALPSYAANRARPLRVARRIDGPRMASNIGVQTDRVRERVAGARMEYGERVETRVAAEDPAQISLASHAEDIMEDRPLREAVVLDSGGTSVKVKYVLNGKPVVRNVASSSVFFFQGDRMQTAATAPAMVDRGDRVLIPEVTTRAPKTSVAEYESERRSRFSTDQVGDTELDPSSRIEGDRIIIEQQDRMDTAGQPVTDRVAGYRSQTKVRSKVAGQRQTIQRRPAK